MRLKYSLFALLIVSLLFGLTSCSTVSYYSQAISGHLKLINAREDIADILKQADLDPILKTKLLKAQQIRRYASVRLGLPDNGSYKSFVATGQDYITWNVVAAREFSVQAKTWCFPVAGCVSYKGYYHQQDAVDLAEQLKQEGYDTTINGATAYSTIGWFDDPILDTMLKGQDIRLAGLIFHELAHQQIYIKGDSDFNEAFATFVEQQGVRIWLKNTQGEQQLQLYEQLLQRRQGFTQLLLDTRKQLQNIYQKDLSFEEKASKKQQAFSQLQINYQVFKQQQHGYSGYDQWFSLNLNNANLVSTSTYKRLVPAFEKIYLAAGQDMRSFYEKVEVLAKKSKQERIHVMD